MDISGTTVSDDLRVALRIGHDLRVLKPLEDLQQVTLGQLAESGAPTVGDRVYIGAGAKVLGNITLGDDVRVGANAVVLENVPSNCTAVGNPARLIVRQTK